MKKFISVIIVLVLALPLSFIVTVITNPLWRYFENVTGIEAFGHSGPAEWCYWFDYSIIVVIFIYGIFKITGK